MDVVHSYPAVKGPGRFEAPRKSVFVRLRYPSDYHKNFADSSRIPTRQAIPDPNSNSLSGLKPPAKRVRRWVPKSQALNSAKS